MKSYVEKGGAEEEGRRPDARLVLPYSPGPAPLSSKPLSRGQRWLVVLFFVPPLAYVALRVAWWAVNRG